jgi:hypothetical protein
MLLGLAQVAGFSLVDLVDGGHIGNESAAWNIAVGTGLLGVAKARRCPPAVFLVLSAFVATLTLLTLTDAVNGVGWARPGSPLTPWSWRVTALSSYLSANLPELKAARRRLLH